MTKYALTFQQTTLHYDSCTETHYSTTGWHKKMGTF